MRILVTGGAGFIGSHLVERLLDLGHEVACLDDFNESYSPARKRRNLVRAAEHTKFRLVEGDIRDSAAVEKVLSDPIDTVVHLAARAGVRASIAQPEIFTSVNVQGTINLLEASRLHKVGHFVFGSSSSVYGAHDTMPFREEGTVYRPISPYAATKLAGEFYCHTYHHLYDLPVTVLRFFTVYGPRQRPEMAIHRFTTLIDQGKEVPIYGDGTTKRDYTYITDIIDGIVEAMKRDKGFDVFNLGNAESVELHRVVYIIARALGNKAKVSHLPPQLGDVPVTCADITKAQALLGYQPRVKIDDGIWRFVHWYERTEVTPRVEREREGAWGS